MATIVTRAGKGSALTHNELDANFNNLNSQKLEAADIAGKANIASPTFTGTVGGIDKTMVGLTNVDNTADASKPVSTAQQTALDLKANLASPTLTGTPAAPTAGGTTNTTQIATTAMVQAAIAAAGINALSDVVITLASTGQVLKFNGTNWVNDTDATGGGGGALDDLTDVVITTPSTGQVLKYNGTNWVNDTDATGGGGSVTVTGTPVNNQLAVWTGSTELEGDSALTFDTTTDTLAIAASGNLAFGAVTVLDDNAGTTTLQNIDAIDATTEATIEAAIDTLANLTSIQGRTVTLADAGADAVLGWDDSASAYQNLSAADVRTALGLTTLATTTPGTNVATFLTTPSSANLRAAMTDEDGDTSLMFTFAAVTLSTATNLVRATHGNRTLVCDTAATHTVEDDTTGGWGTGDTLFGFNTSGGNVVLQGDGTATVTAEIGGTLTVPAGRAWALQRTAANAWRGGAADSIALTTEVSGNLPLANGGLGTSLTDPNADRLPFWDDSAGAVAWLTPGTGLTITGTTITADAGVGVATDTLWDAAGDLAVGTGANTAARLAIGTSLQFLRTNVTATALEWATPAGGGTVTNIGGNLTANSVVLGAGTTDTKVVAGVITDGVSKLTLGVAGTSVGSVDFKNATSGTATIAPPTGALGTFQVTLPNAASTLPIFGQQITFAGPTAARTITLPDAAFTVARTDAANTFTGVQTMTAPVITGGSHIELTGFSLRSTGAAFDMLQATAEVLTADRTLSWVLGDANRTISLAGNVTTAAAFTQAGAFATTITATATSNATLPAGTQTLAALGLAQAWTAAQYVTPSALTDGANIAVNAALSNNFTVVLGGNRTLNNPTNPASGQVINVRVRQDGTGTRTLAYGTAYLFPGGTDPVLSTTANAVDLMSCQYDATLSAWLCNMSKAYA